MPAGMIGTKEINKKEEKRIVKKSRSTSNNFIKYKLDKIAGGLVHPDSGKFFQRKAYFYFPGGI